MDVTKTVQINGEVTVKWTAGNPEDTLVGVGPEDDRQWLEPAELKELIGVLNTALDEVEPESPGGQYRRLLEAFKPLPKLSEGGYAFSSGVIVAPESDWPDTWTVNADSVEVRVDEPEAYEGDDPDNA
jgi:hypothetical protein